MLNYDKMDEVLNNLDNAAESLKQASDLQTKFDKALDGVNATLTEIKTENDSVEQLVVTVKDLSLTHKSIEGKIETVLQDYKKLHSAFELLELELKKNATSVSEIYKNVSVSLKLTTSLANETKSEINTIKNELAESKHCSKKLKIAVLAGIGISLITLAVVVIGFFI